jgi:hypothetical protein
MSLFPSTANYGRPAPVKSDALISACGKYRYWLTRTWDESKNPIAFCMLNPSTATAEVDDPTIRRCMCFARLWDAGGIVVVNLFALRATDPHELLTASHPVAEPDGLAPWHENLNDAWIVHKTDGLRLIAAWGAHSSILGRDRDVLEVLGKNRRIECLGATKAGHPRHPLYVGGEVAPIPFPPSPSPAFAPATGATNV